MMATFILAGEKFELVQSKLTFAEARAVEKFTGHTFAEIMESERLAKSTAVTQALIWVSMKRVRPEVKFSDLDDMPIDDLDWPEEEPEEASESPDPTEG